MRHTIKILLFGMLFWSTISSSRLRAESGSCYSADQLDETFIRTMLQKLVEIGKAFRFPNGDYFAVLENLPNASICELESVDLSDLDLSNVEINETRLKGAILCNTVLPGGAVDRSDCE